MHLFFCEDCKKAIADIKSRGKNVVICGGTGLYIKALTEHYDCGTVVCDEQFRKKCEDMSNEELHAMIENSIASMINLPLITNSI